MRTKKFIDKEAAAARRASERIYMRRIASALLITVFEDCSRMTSTPKQWAASVAWLNGVASPYPFSIVAEVLNYDEAMARLHIADLLGLSTAGPDHHITAPFTARNAEHAARILHAARGDSRNVSI